MTTDVTNIEVDESQIISFFSSITLEKLLPAVITLLICLLVTKFLLRGLEKVLDRSRIEKTLHGFLRTLTRIALYALTVLITAQQLGFQVTSLVAVFSVAALAISLALQGALSNLASGIVLLTSHPFKVGDFVEVDSVSGTVQEIGLTYTQIATPDNKVIFAPNSGVTSGKVINYTVEGKRRVDIVVTASYDCALADVKASLLGSTTRVEKILPDPTPVVYVTAYQDSNIQYTLRCWVATADYWDVYFALMEQVKTDFDENGVVMTYPHINVHMQ
jgi:small conductance mechanosensitive channel